MESWRTTALCGRCGAHPVNSASLAEPVQTSRARPMIGMPGTRKATVAEQPSFDGNRPARVAADRGDRATLISSRLKRLSCVGGSACGYGGSSDQPRHFLKPLAL